MTKKLVIRSPQTIHSDSPIQVKESLKHEIKS